MSTRSILQLDPLCMFDVMSEKFLVPGSEQTVSATRQDIYSHPAPLRSTGHQSRAIEQQDNHSTMNGIGPNGAQVPAPPVQAPQGQAPLPVSAAQGPLPTSLGLYGNLGVGVSALYIDLSNVQADQQNVKQSIISRQHCHPKVQHTDRIISTRKTCTESYQSELCLRPPSHGL